ncbi:MAG TPA: hypothetical protein VI455_14505 [Terriglobia bacterium]
MKWSRSFALLRLFGLALLIAHLNPGVGNAQDFKGEFTLPFDARWGGGTLPAGNYSFTLDKAESSGTLYLSQGTRTVALIHSQGHSYTQSGRCALTVSQSRDGNAVRELSLPQIGVALHYAPRKPRRGTAAAEKEIAQAIPVTIAGK